jgi:glycosyltransferase involved in cell wall biosynthesis
MNKQNRFKLYYFIIISLKQKRWFRKMIAILLFPIGYVVSYINNVIGLNLLLKIFLTDLTIYDSAIVGRIRKILPAGLNDYFGKTAAFPGDATAEYIVLKPYISNYERGLITIHWRWHIDILFRHYDINKILDRYVLILEPDAFGAEWSYPFLAVMNMKNSHVFTVCKDPITTKRLNSLGYKVIPFGGSCDYININKFKKVNNAKKNIDIIMVAHWVIPIKRQYVLFQALEKISRRLNVVFIGIPGNGYTMADIKSLSDNYKLQQHNIQYYDSISQEQVNDFLNRSKMFILTSLVEGFNRACFESFFANVPVIVLSDNLGVPKEYINHSTGIIVRESGMHKAIEYMLDNYYVFSPREWALKNITPQATIQKINDFLCKYSADNSMEWSIDVVAKQWAGQKFEYVDNECKEKYLSDYSFVEDCFIGDFNK